MKHLLQLEWMKYRGNKTMVIFFLSTVVLYPAGLLLTHLFITTIIPEEMPVDLFKFPEIWSLTGYVANWISYFFIALLGMQMITLEYSGKTLRQNLITGLTRTEFLMSKVLFLALTCLVLTIWFGIVTLLLGLYSGSELRFEISEVSKYLFLHFLMVFAYGFASLLIGLIFRVLALSFILFFIYASFIEPAFSRLVHNNIFGGNTYLYYPANAFNDLLPFPYYSQITEMLPPEEQIQFTLSESHAIVASLIYLGLLGLLAWRKMERSNF
ncbi:MAG: hypothetical protein EA411_02040 [Saprospirales bacterium]|nr:MAG: hypothetical protein EA411_02040 [Saprospirales bacterium]